MKHLKLPILYYRFSLKSLLLAFCFLSVFTILSCSKDDEAGSVPEKVIPPTVYPEEDPLDKYYELTGFSVTSNYINSGNYEFGLVFAPLVKGRITAIKLKIPAINSNVRVTFWDYDSKTVIRTETMGTTSANVLFTKSIPELILVKDKKYLITMNSDDWYRRSKADNTSATFPITAGNIRFFEYRWIGGTAQVFPTTLAQNYNAGDLSFNFQQID